MHRLDSYQIPRALPTWPVLALALAASCAGRGAKAGEGASAPVAAPAPEAPGEAAAAETSAAPRPARPGAAPGAGPLVPSGKRLGLAEARAYMVELVNRDRASQGLGPVAIEHGPAEAAAQAHADDMAQHGFLGHWGTDGSVPESRHTRAGGAHMVLENALCVTDTQARGLVKAPTIDAADVERAERMFFDEVPPHDGHRRNILKARHTHLGVGVALPAPRANEITTACFVHELIDDYGTYAPLPKTAKPGAKILVEGTLRAPAKPVGVGLAVVPLPARLSPDEANKRRSYPVPAPFQMSFAKGFKTAIPVAVDGGHFRVELPLAADGREGLYSVSVWASFDGKKELEMVGLRTIEVRR